MPVINHIHKYTLILLGNERIVRDEHGCKKIERVGGYPVMKCILPDCSHFIARQLCLGRTTICWRCGGEMEMKKYNLREKHPKHRECRKQKEAA